MIEHFQPDCAMTVQAENALSVCLPDSHALNVPLSVIMLYFLRFKRAERSEAGRRRMTDC
jgi:hypothetical protein